MNVETHAQRETRAKIEIVSDTEVVVTRDFNAPRELVFEAITSAEHVPHWYGCDLMKMVTCEIDLRVGGRWRYVLRMPDGGGARFPRRVPRDRAPVQARLHRELRAHRSRP